jgi:uncharacterized protein with von Willebrand factor type A (vWA) domain
MVTKKYMNAISRKSVIKTSPGQRFIGRIASLETRGKPTEDDLIRDAFWTYYLHDVRFTKDIPRERIINAKLIKWAMNSERFDQSKAKTTGRMMASSRSAELLVQLLLEDPEVKKAIEAQEELERALQARDQDWVNRAMAGLDQAAEDFDEFTDSMDGKAARSQALSDTQEEVEKEDSFARGWGFDPDKMKGIDTESIRKLLSSLNDEYLRRLIQEIGRVHGIAIEGRETKSKDHAIIANAGYTRDVLKAFPTTRSFLIDETISPEMNLMALAEYADHGVLGMIENSNPISKGGFVMTIDTSGSMDGRPIVIAKALGLGLARAAMENDQRYYATLFSSANQITKPITNESEPKEILEFARFMFNGGTDFDYALISSLKLIDRLEEPENYDVIMVTDMQAGFRSGAIEAMEISRKKYGTRLMILGIGTQVVNLGPHVDFIGNVNSNEDIGRIAKELSEAMQKPRQEVAHA